MFHCHVCGFTEAKEGFVNEVLQIDDKPVLVEHIPVTICARCSEPVFSRETTEKIAVWFTEKQSLKRPSAWMSSLFCRGKKFLQYLNLFPCPYLTG
jgi:YgiT-type zinc finger domain-containing protein